MDDRIQLSKGQIIHIGGLPFELEADTIVLGCQNNLKLLEASPSGYRSLGVDSALTEAQSVTCDTIKPSSESMNGIR